MARKHTTRLNERLDELEQSPFCDVVAADHTDRYPDPKPVNGRVPDYKAQCGPTTVVGEVEQAGDHSPHTQKQERAFTAFDNASPLQEFERVDYGTNQQSQPKSQDSGVLDFGLDLW